MTQQTCYQRLRQLPLIGAPLADRLQGKPVVAVIRLAGVIGRSGGLMRGGLTLQGLEKTLDRAFTLPRLKAVALSINSPGGSPVQAALIASRIRTLAEEKKVPVLAFCEDAAASGGYWLACAADEIHAHPASIVGSIGVVSAGFGFTGLIERIGVERRIYTAGDNKARLDPFRPESAADVRHLKKLQGEIHEQFRNYVRERRKDRLQADEKTLFSGDFWTGQSALANGLVDGLGDLRGVCREKFGETVCFRDLVRPRPWYARRPGLQEGAFTGIATDILTAMENRLLWQRIGTHGSDL